jgi:hypothetical protein
MIEIFNYDTARYQFRQWAQATLNFPNLEALHEHPCGGAKMPSHRVHRFIQSMKTAFAGDIRERFANFVREYAVPRVPFIPWTEVYPNFRVHERGQDSTSPMHRDRDYLKERGSFKIWLPFTRVAGGGALWVESEELLNDMRSYDMEYGQALFFDSLNLLHGCHFNDSPDTRVSIDFIIRRDPTAGSDAALAAHGGSHDGLLGLGQR